MELPAEARTRIERVYERGSEILGRASLPCEPFAAVISAEQHRWAWRPKTVRLVLLAESHVFTTEAESRIGVRRTLLPPAARNAPDSFVRLVCCLGYGEDELLRARPSTANGGTWQYWDLFGLLAGSGKQPRKGRSDLQQRLEWKVETLLRLQQLGVWLLDTSAQAIYAPGGQRIPTMFVDELHRIWWQEHGTALLASLAAPCWCIGQNVHKQSEQFGCKPINWIHQPQARITNATRTLRLSPLLATAQSLWGLCGVVSQAGSTSVLPGWLHNAFR